MELRTQCCGADANFPVCRRGRCPHIKTVPAYNVGPILAGAASSVVDLSWAEINSGKYVINVHKSSTDMGYYVSCANIGVAATPLVIPTDQTPY